MRGGEWRKEKTASQRLRQKSNHRNAFRRQCAALARSARRPTPPRAPERSEQSDKIRKRMSKKVCVKSFHYFILLSKSLDSFRHLNQHKSGKNKKNDDHCARLSVFLWSLDFDGCTAGRRFLFSISAAEEWPKSERGTGCSGRLALFRQIAAENQWKRHIESLKLSLGSSSRSQSHFHAFVSDFC